MQEPSTSLLSFLARDRSFMKEAACLGEATDLFFPSGQIARGSYGAGKAVCATCTVVSDCLSYAMEGESEITASWPGLWGGLTPTERRSLRRSLTGDTPRPRSLPRDRSDRVKVGLDA
ncbi:MAG: WhiB family transcriptional regulator [Acidimicrobiales bacterium]